MKNYSTMDDGAINMLVGESLGLTSYYLNHDRSVQFRNEKGHIKGTKNYCNNPADAWPIIQERGISLSYDGIDWIAFDIFTETKASNNIETHAGKPMRAAMICYLRAIDAEKSHG